MPKRTLSQPGGFGWSYVHKKQLEGREQADPSGWRLPAAAFETAVCSLVPSHLSQLAEAARLLVNPEVSRVKAATPRALHTARQLVAGDADLLRTLVNAVTVSPAEIRVNLDAATIADRLGVAKAEVDQDCLSFTAPFQLRRRGVEAKIVAGERVPAPDAVLVRTLQQAHLWLEQINSGKSLTKVAQAEGHSPSFVRVRIGIALLSPRIQSAIVEGTQPPELSLQRIVRTRIPLEWAEQERLLGFAT